MAAKCNDSKTGIHKGSHFENRREPTNSFDPAIANHFREKSHCIYDSVLKALREEEKSIQLQISIGIDHAEGRIIVIELCKHYTPFARRFAKIYVDLHNNKESATR